MQKINVKPRAGILVRHEDTGKPVKEAGEAVPNTAYYRRRIKDGDLIKVEETPAAAKAPATKKGADK